MLEVEEAGFPERGGVMGNRLFAVAVAAVLVGGCVHRAEPLAAGRYCLSEQLVGDTGRETFPLGEFWMVVDVEQRDGRDFVSFANKMPDNPEILMADLAPASRMPGGSLRFEFEDGWGNQGRGRLRPDGRIVLEVTRPSPDGGTNITRNYGSFRVSRAECDPELRAWRPVG